MARATYIINKPAAVPGPQGPPGDTGPEGPQGPQGDGVPVGGTNRQLLKVIGGVPAWQADRVFDVRDYGAVGDGVTDDRAAFQLALDAIQANGGGTLYVPHGYTFLLGFRAGTYFSSFKVCCWLYGSNVTIEGGGTIRVTTGNAAGFAVFASTGDSAISSATVDTGTWWNDNDYVDRSNSGSNYPVYAIAAASAGDGSVTLSTPAQHSNFAVGDGVLIRTGQTLSQAGEGQPDAELNEIAAINTGTGELTLKYPLAKDYVQEYFATASKDTATTTSSTAWPADFGIQNVEDTISRNLTVRDVTFDVVQSTGQGYCLAFGSVLGYTIDRVRLTGTNVSLQTGGPYRRARFDADVDVALNLQADVFLSADRGCGDVTMTGTFTNRGSQVGLFHIHEGTYRVTLDRPRISNPPSSSANHAIQIIGRSYDAAIIEPDIEHDTSSAFAIYIADATCKRTKIINPRRLINPFGISNSGSDTMLRGCDSRIENYAPVAGGPITRSVAIYHNSPQENIIGTIPAGYTVLPGGITVQVLEQFNGAGAEILVGKSIVFYTWFTSAAASIDISPGMATDLVQTATTGFYQPNPADIDVIYTANGSTAGKALVRVVYEPVMRVLGV